MKKLVLVCGILAGVVSIGECIDVKDKILAENLINCIITEEYNECQNIVNSGFIPPAYVCEKLGRCVIGAVSFKVLGNKDKEAQYAKKIISLSPTLLQQDIVVAYLKKMDANIAQHILGGAYFRLVEYYREKNDGENFIKITANGCARVGMSEEHLPFLCNWAGVVLEKAKMYREAQEFFKKVCDLNLKPKFSEMLGGSGDGCLLLASLYNEGNGVRQDYAKVAELLKKGCDLDSSMSCVGLGESYLNGKGVVKNLPIAKRLFGKGCDLGEQVGCDEYRKLNQAGVR